MRLAACSAGLSLLLGGCADHDALPPAQVEHHASVACPLKTPAAWQTFSELAANDAHWVQTCSDQDNCQELVGDFAEHVQRDVLDTLASCSEDVRKNPNIDACTANLRRFAPAWLRQHGSQAYGFEQTNHDYFAAQTSAEAPPGMMDPPSALLGALPARAALALAAQRAGWSYLTHDSCLGGVRTFINIVDPDDRFEQWLLLGVDPQAEAIADPAIMSFLAVQKRAADGSLLEQVRVHFRDYRLSQLDGVWQAALPEQGDGKCYACHGSGVRQLLPFSSTDNAAVLDGLNQRLASYGLPDWNGSIRTADYGPALGAELGCTHCHDGEQRGPLTVFTSEGMLYQKVVEQLSMRAFDGSHAVPDQAAMRLLQQQKEATTPLSPSELQALARARTEHEADYAELVASRLPALVGWLLETPCD